MKKIIHKSVSLNLVGLNGNAYALIGAFNRQARKEGWSQDEIDAVVTEAKNGNYVHLLATIENHCQSIEDD